jgi:hypothetical protein
VVVPRVTQHWGMLRRNPVYTAVTRGQRLMVVVGQPRALAIAVRGAQTRRRWSKLGDWLGGEGVTSPASSEERGCAMRPRGHGDGPDPSAALPRNAGRGPFSEPRATKQT